MQVRGPLRCSSPKVEPSPDAWILVLSPDVPYQDGAARQGGTHNALPEVLASSKLEHSHAEPGCYEPMQSLRADHIGGRQSERIWWLPIGRSSLLSGTQSSLMGCRAELPI